MKKIIILLILMLIMVPFALAGTLTRSFNPSTVSPGGEVQVVLTVALDDSDNKLVITEDYPDGFTFSRSSVGSIAVPEAVPNFFDTSTPGVLKKADTSTSLYNTFPLISYTLTAPSTAGNYVFSGTYILTGTSTTPIVGATSLTVGATTDSCNDGCDSTATCESGACVCGPGETPKTINGKNGCETVAECSPDGLARCNPSNINQRQTCESGEWLIQTDCQFGCTNGVCNQNTNVCNAGDITGCTADSSGFNFCNSAGTGYDLFTCPAGQVCSGEGGAAGCGAVENVQEDPTKQQFLDSMEEKYDEAQEEQGWTTRIISSIARLLKNTFSLS
jgi:hypothetical protein